MLPRPGRCPGTRCGGRSLGPSGSDHANELNTGNSRPFGEDGALSPAPGFLWTLDSEDRMVLAGRSVWGWQEEDGVVRARRKEPVGRLEMRARRARRGGSPQGSPERIARGHFFPRPHVSLGRTGRRLRPSARNACSGLAQAITRRRQCCHAGWILVTAASRSIGPPAAGVALVIGSSAHAREPLGRARCRRPRRINGQPQVRQDLLDHRTVLDRRQPMQPPAAVGTSQNVQFEHAAQKVGPDEMARPHVGGRRRFGPGSGTRRASHGRRHPLRRVLDDDRPAVAAPARRERAMVGEQVDAWARNDDPELLQELGRLEADRARAITPQVRNSRSSRSTNPGRPSPPPRRRASARKVSRCSRTIRCRTLRSAWRRT